MLLIHDVLSDAVALHHLITTPISCIHHVTDRELEVVPLDKRLLERLERAVAADRLAAIEQEQVEKLRQEQKELSELRNQREHPNEQIDLGSHQLHDGSSAVPAGHEADGMDVVQDGHHADSIDFSQASFDADLALRVAQLEEQESFTLSQSQSQNKHRDSQGGIGFT